MGRLALSAVPVGCGALDVLVAFDLDFDLVVGISHGSPFGSPGRSSRSAPRIATGRRRSQ
ncbi:hypothetical protein D8S78_05430 [Natrialba swarupiae]|nr:hypothetical protein [Natrialba swarupiae]